MKTSQKIRLLSLGIFLALLTWFGYQHQVLGGGPAGSPTVDALCPFGGLESLASYVQHNTWLRRIAPSSLVLFAATALMTLLLGRVFCGWICPMGALTEFSGRLARRMGFCARIMPPKLDAALRLLKYVLLVFIIVLTWHFGTLVFRNYDPWMAWMHLSAGLSEAGLATLVLVAVLLAEFFYSRFWCNYLCPLGAVFAIGQKISFLKIRRNPQTCINCGKCNRACPTGLQPMTAVTLKSGDCIACGQCAEACPKADTLTFSFGGKKTVSVLMAGVMGLGFFGACYAGAKISGVWASVAEASAIRAQNPAERIFGWMTLPQVAETLKLPLDKVISIAGIAPGTPLNQSLKSLAAQGGVNDEIVQARLAAWFTQEKSTAERLPLPVNPDEIRGSMTLAELGQAFNVDYMQVLKKAGWSLEAGYTEGAKSLKDLATAQKKEVQDIRKALKAVLAGE